MPVFSWFGDIMRWPFPSKNREFLKKLTYGAEKTLNFFTSHENKKSRFFCLCTDFNHFLSKCISVLRKFLCLNIFLNFAIACETRIKMQKIWFYAIFTSILNFVPFPQYFSHNKNEKCFVISCVTIYQW